MTQLPDQGHSDLSLQAETYGNGTLPPEGGAPNSGVSGSYLTKRRTLVVLITLCAGLGCVAILALTVGSERISSNQLFSALFAKLMGTTPLLTREQELIVFKLRLPRIAMAVGVGSALAIAGAAFQSLLRNPLADPYILGVSGGAAFGSILAILFAGEIALARPIFGFIGAALATFIVYQIGKRRDDPAHLVLAGVVMSTFLSSLIVLLTALADSVRLRNITIWLLGDLSSGTVEGLIFVIIAVILGASILILQSRALNLMMIGERDAFALGVETARVRFIVYLTASLLTGAAVTAGGAIGYVGLVVPHLMRLSAGTDNRLVIPASGLAGGLLVLIADTVARTALSPRELPTGAITALIGAPVFVYLLLRGR
jgi:ABC-type Fe3+-siderophore transport system permease subunit